jgi:Tol biopolymer transport system component
LTASGCALAVIACESRTPVPAPVIEQVASAVPPTRPVEPSLHTARDAHVTAFGELPDQSRVPFHARAASPMTQHTETVEGADFDVDASPDGSWLVFSSTRHSAQPDLYLKTANGRAVTQLTADPAADVQPSFSPDGKWIVFSSHRSGNWDLWLKSLQGGQPIQITRSPLHEVHPSFAPDGRRLVYCLFNSRAGQWELWTLTLNQSGSRRVIGVGLFPEWSPVEDSIVYQRARERGGRWFSIWRIDLSNGEPTFPVEVAASSEMALIQPSWSPDGKWITYGSALLKGGEQFPGNQSPILTQGDIWIVAKDGSAPLKLTDGQGTNFGSAWSADQRIYFTSQQNGTENVWSAKPLLTGIAQDSVNKQDSDAGRVSTRSPAGEGSGTQGG